MVGLRPKSEPRNGNGPSLVQGQSQLAVLRCAAPRLPPSRDGFRCRLLLPMPAMDLAALLGGATGERLEKCVERLALGRWDHAAAGAVDGERDLSTIVSHPSRTCGGSRRHRSSRCLPSVAGRGGPARASIARSAFAARHPIHASSRCGRTGDRRAARGYGADRPGASESRIASNARRPGGRRRQ